MGVILRFEAQEKPQRRDLALDVSEGLESSKGGRRAEKSSEQKDGPQWFKAPPALAAFGWRKVTPESRRDNERSVSEQRKCDRQAGG